MDIEKEQNIIVRYIPQYIVIETHFKSKNEKPQIFNTTARPTDDCHKNLELQNSIQGTNFGECEVIPCDDDQDDEESAEIKEFDIFEAKPLDVTDCNPNDKKRKSKSEAKKLLNKWFLSHLHNPYPTEDEKDALMLKANMTRVQINYWFINKRKRSKHLLDNSSKTSGDFECKTSGDFEFLENDENSSNAAVDGTTVELEVTIQPDTPRKRRQKKMGSDTDLVATCDICGKSFPSYNMLQSHLKRHDPSTWETCKICHKSFPDGLKRHMRVHSGERPYVCNQCGAAYKQAYGLTMHKALHNDSGELFYCDTCNNGRAYRSKYALKDHLKLHYRAGNEDLSPAVINRTWKPPKICTICGFETYNMRSHMIARHSTLRPFKCEICSESFKFKKDLQTHLAYHSDEMNFQCEECKKRFKTKRKLVIHKRIHSSEKSYICTVCDRSFLVSTYLKKHMRLHTGEKKRHACTQCPKDYSGITDLRRHLEREHGIRVEPNPKYSNNNMTKKKDKVT